jgi:hypothetical protein
VREVSDIERAVLEQLLAEDRWSRAALKVKLERFTPAAVDSTIATFTVEGLCDYDGRAVQASRCLRWLDERGMLRDSAPPNGAPDRETLDRIIARSAAERTLGKV